MTGMSPPVGIAPHESRFIRIDAPVPEECYESDLVTWCLDTPSPTPQSKTKETPPVQMCEIVRNCTLGGVLAHRPLNEVSTRRIRGHHHVREQPVRPKQAQTTPRSYR